MEQSDVLTVFEKLSLAVLWGKNWGEGVERQELGGYYRDGNGNSDWARAEKRKYRNDDV